MTSCRSSFFLRNAQLVALDLGLDALRALFPDDLGDLPGVVLGDALFQGTARRYSLPEPLGSPASRTFSETWRLTSFSLNTSSTALGALLAVRLDLHSLIAGPGDRRPNATEIEPCADLLGRLVQRVVDFLMVDLDTMSKEDSRATAQARRSGCACRHAGRAGCAPGGAAQSDGSEYWLTRPVASSALSFTVPPGEDGPTAGCPSGQRERSVKPSAQPTLVRTQHLPPPAETARCCGNAARRAVSSCHAVYQGVSLWVDAWQCVRTYGVQRPGETSGAYNRSLCRSAPVLSRFRAPDWRASRSAGSSPYCSRQAAGWPCSYPRPRRAGRRIGPRHLIGARRRGAGMVGAGGTEDQHGAVASGAPTMSCWRTRQRPRRGHATRSRIRSHGRVEIA